MAYRADERPSTVSLSGLASVCMQEWVREREARGEEL